MHPRVHELIDVLDLEPHREGGYFRRVFASEEIVSPADARGPRVALTSIHYLLAAGQTSRWHRVASDEAWHHCEGDPIELFALRPGLDRLHRWVLGPVGEDAHIGRAVRRESAVGSPAGGKPIGGDSMGRDAAFTARTEPVHVVPAGWWQAARPMGEYALAGCSVGPGFAYEDFELMTDRPSAADELRRRHPDLADLL